MTDISIAFQDLIESKLKFVEDQFTSEHDDAKHIAKHTAKNDIAKNDTAKNFTENIAKNLE